MYAVIKAKGHQYRVKEGETILVDCLAGKDGDKVVFDKVLMISGTKKPAIGTPLVSGATVEGIIKRQTFNPKVIVFKYKRRKNYKRTRGHKQPMTMVEINKIKS